MIFICDGAKLENKYITKSHKECKKSQSNIVHQAFLIFAFTLLLRFDLIREILSAFCCQLWAYCWQGTINVPSEKSEMTDSLSLACYPCLQTKPLNTNKMSSHVQTFRKYTLAIDKKYPHRRCFCLLYRFLLAKNVISNRWFWFLWNLRMRFALLSLQNAIY